MKAPPAKTKRKVIFSTSKASLKICDGKTEAPHYEHAPMQLSHLGSPWRRYRDVLTLLGMGDEIIIASEHEAPTKRVGVRKFHRGERDIETLSRFRALRHVNIVAAVEAFIGQEILYVAFEEMHMPLENIVRCPRRPTSNEVGVILGQVLDGLAYLELHQLYHSYLSCETVLVHADGDVKIGMQEQCRAATPQGKKQNVMEVGTMAMKLMQGYSSEDGEVGVEDNTGWSDSILAVLSSVASCDGASQLRKNAFFTQLWKKESRWPKETLCDLIVTTLISVHRYYKYKPQTFL
ncbi:uncharacterized protein F5Z01DRAFT_217573 [Emericellopsis atlantica]|uniref:Serine-threonine/tyrosine-protein kinase catalytic domain-containing protein n=1 Tax=Emericellopsis atlantica TaxID=2614577 RepID=A0A9P7ZIU7_9HYPO|nr:uncharacterized protein F5Z01DRAFT_217573 [Emericellopsis atlantica]KAG9252577.1 hypothetical protein F5Z01DRAFT_217573 [Emericellopsis atlantica]